MVGVFCKPSVILLASGVEYLIAHRDFLARVREFGEDRHLEKTEDESEQDDEKDVDLHVDGLPESS